MTGEIVIDPITRLEGHGRIDIFLDGTAGWTAPTCRSRSCAGFEKFAQGRPSRGHAPDHLAHLRRLPHGPPHGGDQGPGRPLQGRAPAGRPKIRELVYSTFMVEDHALHFYFLGGPDFIVGPDAPKAKRNILGVIDKVGPGDRQEGHRHPPAARAS